MYLNLFKIKIMKLNNLILIGISILAATSCTPDCKDDVSSYNSGYSGGKLMKVTGASGSCSDYANGMIDQGFNVDANDCYCAGFNDGKSGNENKYKND